ncbi:MAG: hypothetical protein ACOVP8_04115 [Phycisphaerales bacterium]
MAFATRAFAGTTQHFVNAAAFAGADIFTKLGHFFLVGFAVSLHFGLEIAAERLNLGLLLSGQAQLGGSTFGLERFDGADERTGGLRAAFAARRTAITQLAATAGDAVVLDLGSTQVVVGLSGLHRHERAGKHGEHERTNDEALQLHIDPCFREGAHPRMCARVAVNRDDWKSKTVAKPTWLILPHRVCLLHRAKRGQRERIAARMVKIRGL